jgi:hypothetical protein
MIDIIKKPFANHRNPLPPDGIMHSFETIPCDIFSQTNEAQEVLRNSLHRVYLDMFLRERKGQSVTKGRGEQKVI